MSLRIKAGKIATVVLRPHIIAGRAKYLFILSHMRSRSSVLSHILGSNDGVCGYGELHISYMRYVDIVNMRIQLYRDLRCDFRGRYLLDKILHNDRGFSEKVLSATKPKVIFLLRDPESTIKSIISMGRSLGEDAYEDPGEASRYYCSRLSRLAEYARIFRGNFTFIDSDALVGDTDRVLGDLADWLGFETPLRSHYRKFRNTGKLGHGDPSGNIRAGSVIETKGHPDVEIPAELLKEAKVSYEMCRASLMPE